MKYVLIHELHNIAEERQNAYGKRSVLSTLRRQLFRGKSYPSTKVKSYANKDGIYPLPRDPPQSIKHHVLDPRGDANQHTKYVVPIGHYPKRAGSWYVGQQLTYEQAEDFIKEMFSEEIDGIRSIVNTSTNRNRHVDLQRITMDYCQSIEVKLTSGHYDTAPGMIRSSEMQLNALLNYQHFDFLEQLIPSLYAIVSVDRLKMPWDFPNPRQGMEHIDFTKPQYFATVWFIPVYDEDDFLILDTLHQGKISEDELRVEPRELPSYLRQDERRNDLMTV